MAALASPRPSFSGTSAPDGHLLGTLHVPSNEIVTSFSSKSELALNRSADGKSLTFMGYRGGPGCPTLTLDPTTNILTQGTNVGPIFADGAEPDRCFGLQYAGPLRPDRSRGRQLCRRIRSDRLLPLRC